MFDKIFRRIRRTTRESYIQEGVLDRTWFRRRTPSWELDAEEEPHDLEAAPHDETIRRR